MVDALALGASGETHGGSSPLPPTNYLMKHAVIYIPGLGDNKWLIQGILVWLWRLYGVKSVTRTMSWADGSETFEQKLTQLLVEIDEHRAKGRIVSLVAASAGATAAIHAYVERPNDINGVVTIAGKINHPETVHRFHETANPIFWQAAQLMPQALVKLTVPAKLRILSIRARHDPIVTASDSYIEGAHNEVAWTSGHSLTILWQLLFGARKIVQFLKQQA